MEHPHSRRFPIFWYFLLEVAILVAAFFATHILRESTSALWGLKPGPLQVYLWLCPVWVCVSSISLLGFKGYSDFRSRDLIWHGLSLAGVSAISVISIYALLAILKEHEINRSFVGLLGVVSFLFLLGTRLIVISLVRHHSRKGYDRRYVLVVGRHAEALELARTLEALHDPILEVRGLVCEDSVEVDEAAARWKVVGKLKDLTKLTEREPIDEIYLSIEAGRLEDYRELLEQCETTGITTHIRLRAFERLESRLDVHRKGEGVYLSLTRSPIGAVRLAVKRTLDMIGALVMLLLLGPLLLLVAVLIRLTSRGSAIFRQERAGMNGRVFTMYKFRTMYDGSEQERFALEASNQMTGPVFKLKNDPRITRLGRFLRRTSIDELPQLLNVLKGDMSLVGPRPLPTYEVEKLEPWQRRRMSMRPGITCLWQVLGRNGMTDFSEWVRLDLEYVDRWSLALDLKILIRTIPAVLVGRGAY